MTLELGPHTREALKKCVDTYEVPGEEPLSEDEWLLLFSAIGLSMVASQNRDRAVVAECERVVAEASLRTGLPLRRATIWEG